MKSKLFKNIPNILTSFRIILTIISFIMFLNNYYYSSIIIMGFAALTDFFDGKIARKYSLCTRFGAFLDVIADKIFVLSLITLLLILGNSKIIYVLSFEAIYILFHLIYRIYNKEWHDVFMAGKIKTACLFVTIILGFISFKVGSFETAYVVFIYISIVAEINAIITIARYLYQSTKY